MYGDNSTITGNISSLPTSISNVITSFDSGEYMEKFAVGPTFAIPGPILFIVAAIAVKLVVKSKLSKLMIKKRYYKYHKISRIKHIYRTNGFMLYNSSVHFNLYAYFSGEPQFSPL